MFKPSKKKFIVLDDIDNINEQSQQVFRNYINTAIMYIFSYLCTNIQKVIDNIQSRSIIIQLNKISTKLLKQFSSYIEKNENIIIHPKRENFCSIYVKTLFKNYLFS